MKKVIKIVVGVFAVIVLLGIVAGGSDDSSGNKSKTENVKWNTNFEDPMAVVQNLDNCKKIMMKMDSVAANAKKVSPAEVMKNPTDYFGIVLEMGATIDELEDFPPNSGGAKFFEGGVAHAIIATASDGTKIMASKKGVADEKVGQFTVLVGMLAGIQTLPGENGETKLLFITGSPK